jgi:isopenicillin-N N-acyltransferase-like protein
MKKHCNRRTFLKLAGWGALASGLPFPPRAAAEFPKVADHTLTTITGKPRDRGKQYGQKFKETIQSFRDKEVYCFAVNPPSRDDLLRYAGACAKEIKAYCPAILDELEGIAEGAKIKVEEAVLIALHEELFHKGILPAVEHCTAMAVGPPDTRDGNTYVGQNWDWMGRLYGQSSVLLWKREEGPSVLAYSYPGLWIAAGLNSAGIALTWTSTPGIGVKGPRVGIPTYVLLAHLLYQDSLQAAIKEARRAKQAGWFTFVLADSKGQIVNIEGSPEKLVVERDKGHLARVYYGSREMTGTPKGRPVPCHPQCVRMLELLRGGKGRLDRPTLQGFFGDHQKWGTGDQNAICKHPDSKGSIFTIDSMLFNCTTKEAYISRGPGCSGRWRRFVFEER